MVVSGAASRDGLQCQICHLAMGEVKSFADRLSNIFSPCVILIWSASCPCCQIWVWYAITKPIWPNWMHVMIQLTHWCVMYSSRVQSTGNINTQVTLIWRLSFPSPKLSHQSKILVEVVLFLTTCTNIACSLKIYSLHSHMVVCLLSTMVKGFYCTICA